MDNIFRALKKDALSINSVEDIRKEIDKIGNISFVIDNFEKNSLIHKKSFIKKNGNSKNAISIKLLNSKIKERQEINEKLKILAYHLSLIKATKLTKDYNTARRCIHQFTTNEFTKVNKVLDDIDQFKNDISKLNKNYEEFLRDYPITLDYKITTEFAFKKTIEKLSNINKKQTQITSILGKSFVKSAKEIVNDKNYRKFIKDRKF